MIVIEASPHVDSPRVLGTSRRGNLLFNVLQWYRGLLQRFPSSFYQINFPEIPLCLPRSKSERTGSHTPKQQVATKLRSVGRFPCRSSRGEGATHLVDKYRTIQLAAVVCGRTLALGSELRLVRASLQPLAFTRRGGRTRSVVKWHAPR